MVFALWILLASGRASLATSQNSSAGGSSAFLQRREPESRSLSNDFWNYNPYINNYETVAGVGGWGGQCTCPNGEVYEVGDNNDGCGSLACIGGVASPCDRQYKSEREGKRVTCGSPGWSNPSWNDDLHICDTLLFESGCAWTHSENCPGQTGGIQTADRSKHGGWGYKCCCDHQLWKWELEGRDSRTSCSHDAQCGNFQICLHKKCFEWPSNGGRKPGNSCSDNHDCINFRCVQNTCSSGQPGDKCETDADCVDDACVRNTCSGRAKGDACEKDSDCASNYCYDDGSSFPDVGPNRCDERNR